LGPDLSTWKNLNVNLPNGRAHDMGSSVIGNKWFISGGQVSLDSVKSTTVWDGSQFVDGPDMPKEKMSHCQLTINSTHIFITNSNDLPGTYILDWENEVYHVVDDIPRQSLYASCGLLNNVLYGLEILVADGKESFIFSLIYQSWRDGPKLPDYIVRTSSAPTKNGFVAIGGRSDGDRVSTIYKFDETIYEWNLEEPKLKIGRDLAASVAVPDSFVNCL